ncbi:MAG: hypothetical protein HOI35_03185 [Woeseia sp.]|jgi:hypothetical protein|nr:hypothetical protein [Woeseia sp.]MBT6209010.1 hypothetical protein [Woeseia sp.]
MSEEICCFRCGESLEYLSLPLSRRDECRGCRAPVHICRMCIYFDPLVLKQCTEDDAEEVSDKEKVNFCEWFKPAPGAFDALGAGKAAKSKTDLDALFGDGLDEAKGTEVGGCAAKDLFK